MGMMTCVMCGREMASYSPIRRCTECLQKQFRDGIFKSLSDRYRDPQSDRQRDSYKDPYFSASPEPETTDWIKPMGEKFQEHLGIEPVAGPDGLHTERYSKPRTPNMKQDPFDYIGAARWHTVRHSEADLLAPFSEREQANLRFYKHMVEIGVVEHQTEPAKEEEE